MPRVVLGLVVFAALCAAAWFLLFKPVPAPQGGPVENGGGGPEGGPAGQSPGKLVVLVVFDQMRGDYLDRWAAQYGPDGFERMKKGGAWYSDCHTPYACTSTGPGHASLITGAPPSVHGIIENDWFDRKAQARVYCAQPSRPFDRVPPFTGKEAKSSRGTGGGFSPERLLAATVGEGLKASRGNPGRVIALSLKDRCAAMMGGLNADAAYAFDTRDGVFHTTAYYAEKPHPWAAEFNAAGLVNTWFDKSWERFRPDLDYDKLAGPDAAPGEAPGTNKMGVVFPHPLKGELTAPGPKYYAAVETSPFGNDLLFALTKKVIEAEKLGASGMSDLLCVSFSSNDLIGHLWGPDSHEVLDVTLRSDHTVGELLRLLDEKVGTDRYVVVVTADHGVCPIPEQKRLPAAERRALGTLMAPLSGALDEAFGKTPTPAAWFDAVEDAGNVWPWVYLNRRAVEARKLNPDEVADFVAQWVGNRPVMEAAFTRKQIETNTPPATGAGREAAVKELLDKVRLAYHPDRCGDVIAVPKPGVQLTEYANGTSHGSPHPYDTHIPLLVYGRGVPAVGKRVERVSSLAVAPVLAWALGVPPPDQAKEPLPPGLRK
jgi:hypothetical protein